MPATYIEPPPQPQGGNGCFAKGCLILVVLFIVMSIAFVCGSIYAVRHLRTTFFTRQSVKLPPNQSAPDKQQLALANWQIFERSARAHQAARIEMTADDLNA